jgi:hypothetical protein
MARDKHGMRFLLAALALAPLPALAHATGRGFVLLLPTGHYIVGGALAVAASFAVLWLVRPEALERVFAARLTFSFPLSDARGVTTWLSLAGLAVLVSAGWLGSRDPLSNPLPLAVWTLFWTALPLVTAVVGNVFAWLDPWRGPAALAGRLDAPPPVWLARLGYGPAILQFLAFGWFELVYPAPDDPARLAWAVSSYWVANLLGVLAFGHAHWTSRCEPFSVFFAMIARLALLERSDGKVNIGLPAARLLAADPLPVSGAIFLLLVLGTVSFDGLMHTFTWMDAIGVNPLEFPGRSAVVLPNSFGLLVVPGALAALFFFAVAAGDSFAGVGAPLSRGAGLLAWSMAPIALVYHLAHYLIALLVEGQYALVAISDPYSLGWNLFGTADTYVSAGLVMGPDSAWVLWNVQAAAIVGGHMLAVVAAHMLAARLHRDGQTAVRSQIPLTILMIAYTVFGLWLLSAPTGA